MTISYLEIPFSIDVHVNRVIHVTPSKPTPNATLPLSTIDSDYYHDVPVYILRVYKVRFDCKLDPADVLREAISKALVNYYPLAGKLRRREHGRVYVHCNAVGVSFVVASAKCKLSDVNYLDGIDVRYSKLLVCDFLPEDETGMHPMVLQVTTFLCGGFTIGTGMLHAICDGTGYFQILNELTELASGRSEPSAMPAWERERLNGSFLKEPVQLPMDPAAAAVSPYLPTTDLVWVCFHVDNDCLRRLKSSLMKECTGDPTLKESSITTHEALGAYVWRSKCKALKLNGDGETLLCISVGLRKRMQHPLPIGYYGNAYVSVYLTMKIMDLKREPLINVVKRIKELKNHAMTEEFMRNALDNSETRRRLQICPKAAGAVTDLTDWRQLGLEKEVDFGWGRSVNVISTSKDELDDEDTCTIAPPSSVNPSMGDGVRVFIKLPKACIAAFREELDALEDKLRDM